MSDGHLEELENVVLELEEALFDAKVDLDHQNRRELERGGINVPPYRWQDTNGRYILLDALVSIVTARTALVNARQNIPREEISGDARCNEEILATEYFKRQDIEPEWLRCDWHGPHNEHANARTGARWRTGGAK